MLQSDATLGSNKSKISHLIWQKSKSNFPNEKHQFRKIFFASLTLRLLRSRLRRARCGPALQLRLAVLLDGTAEHTKAQEVVPIARRAPAPESRTTVQRRVEPATAPVHPAGAHINWVLIAWFCTNFILVERVHEFGAYVPPVTRHSVSDNHDTGFEK